MCTPSKTCLLSFAVFKPLLRLGQKTQTRTLFGLDTRKAKTDTEIVNIFLVGRDGFGDSIIFLKSVFRHP
jgi:hypothetical protein